MFLKNFLYLVVAILLLNTVACKSDYEKMLDRELSSGQRKDSLFLGMYFGMRRDSFFNHCLRLNAEGKITSGPKNMTAQYILPGSDPRINLNFYPRFYGDSIVVMDGYFDYASWSLWAENFHSDKLFPVVMDTLEKWYGPGFLDVSKDDKKVFVKVTGNRRIRAFIKDKQTVQLEIKNLKAPEASKD
ncbi:MAG: hypothetical protein IT269_03690 [Saprospiraceae bacterium]|nr:hypothetical protein [Saprospiraceae bacterium]